jgi:hypothetical protein
MGLEQLDLSGDLDDKTIKGNTDGTKIGNVADALKVNIVGSSFNPLTAPATYTFAAIDTTVANNKHMLSIANTGIAPVYVRSVRIINSQTTPVTGVIGEFRLLRITTHSGGTLITGISADTADIIPATLIARTNSTVTGLGTIPYRRSKWSTDEWNSGAQDVESTDHIFHTLLPWYVPGENTKPITLRQNEGITVQQVVNTTVGSFTIFIEVSS